jgi:hypothetical protein
MAARCVTALAPLVNCPCNFSHAFATSPVPQYNRAGNRSWHTFTQAIDDYNAVFYVAELCNAFMLADKIDILVDLIGNDKNIRMLFQTLSQCFQFIFAVNCSRWIARRRKNEQFGFICNIFSPVRTVRVYT